MIRVSQTELNIKEHLSTLKPQKNTPTNKKQPQTNKRTNKRTALGCDHLRKIIFFNTVNNTL